MKKVLALFISLLSLALCACSPAAAPAAPEESAAPGTSAAPAKSDAVETLIFYKDIQYYEQRENDMLLCRVEFPMLIMDKAQTKEYMVATSVDALNASLAKSAEESYGRLLNSVRSDIELNVENASGYYSKTDALLLRADSLALSVILRTESYSGGGRTALSYGCANFDSATGRQLELKSVCGDIPKLVGLIGEELEKNYPEAEFYDLEAAMEGYAQNSENLVWSLDYQGLSFYFAPYELADEKYGPMSVGLRFDRHPGLFSLYYSRQPYSYAVPVVDGRCLNIDVDMDGVSDLIGVTGIADGGGWSGLDISVNSRVFTMNTAMERCDAYVIYAGPGRCYLFVNAHNATPFGYVGLYRLERSGASLLGMIYDSSLHAAGYTAECAGIPLLTRPENIILGTRVELLGTLTGLKNYSIGSGGLPESRDEVYRVYADTVLTAKTELVTAAIDPVTGSGLNSAAKIAPGTKLYFHRSDGRSYVDMMSEDGVCVRMFVSGKGQAQTVNGMPAADCFDGLVYK